MTTKNDRASIVRGVVEKYKKDWPLYKRVVELLEKYILPELFPDAQKFSARSKEPSSIAGKVLKKYVQLGSVDEIYNKFTDVLTKEGVEEIPAKGEKFDLNKHEALMVQESEDVENGYIIEELMKGYMYKDKVLKYSKVIVCKK